MRKVICHYHIFKNSGTSFDHLLQKNYGSRHVSFDGPFPFFIIDQEQLGRIIERKMDMIAFSSHQIQLPVPVSLNFLVLPVVFLRHPLLRVQSIYNFKRKKYDGTKTSRNAREMSFDKWVKCCFSDRMEITHISNAQTRMLGAAYRKKTLMRINRETGMEYDLHQAIRNIENVQLLARTENFNEDVERFSKILSQYEIQFNFININPLNTTTQNYKKPLCERIEKVKESLTKENYNTLLKVNSQDSILLDYASNLIENRPLTIYYKWLKQN